MLHLRYAQTGYLQSVGVRIYFRYRMSVPENKGNRKVNTKVYFYYYFNSNSSFHFRYARNSSGKIYFHKSSLKFNFHQSGKVF
jgi:hypothetical protein